MINLVTGTPGAGKTLFVVREIVKKTDGSRPVVHNINGFRPQRLPRSWKLRFKKPHEIRELIRSHRDRWSYVRRGPDDLARSWQDQPDGTIIVLDEVQRDWPSKFTTASAPGYIMALDTHRHRGFDFWLISQGLMLISPPVRMFVGRHYDLVRPSQLSYSKISITEGANPSPPRPTGDAVQEGERVAFDKTLFPMYKSASVHSGNVRFPKKIVIFAVVLLVGVAGVAWQISPFIAKIAAAGDPVEADPADGEPVETVCKRIVSVNPLSVRVASKLLDISRSGAEFDLLTRPGYACIERNGNKREGVESNA